MVDVALVTPAYDGRVHDDHARSIEQGLRALNKAGLKAVRICITGDAVLPRVRNSCVAAALAAGADKVVMIDSDIGFDPAQLVRLVSHSKNIVGAAPQAQLKYWRDAATPHCVWRPFPGERMTDEHGLVEAAGLATGFLMVRACVFRELVREGKAQRYIYPGTDPRIWPHMAMYFSYEMVPIDLANDPALAAQCDANNIPPEARVMFEGEDYYLCNRVRELGFTCWLDTALQVRHWEGRSKHDFSIAEILAINAAQDEAA